MRRKKHRKNKHIFFSSFIITLVMVFSLAAMIETDYNCRFITSGDTSPPFTMWTKGESEYLTINSFGLDLTYEITDFVNSFKKMLEII